MADVTGARPGDADTGAAELDAGVAAPDATDVLDTAAAGTMVLRGGALRFGGFALSLALSLGGVALVTRQLGVEDYGRYQTVLSLITIVGAVTDAGMATLGVREYAQRTGQDRDALMRTLLGLRLGLTAAGVVVAGAVAAAAGYGSELVLGAVLAGLGLAAIVVQTTLAIPLGVGLRNGALAGIDVLRQSLTLAGFVLVAVLGGGVAAYLAVPLPVGLVLLAIGAALVRREISLLPKFDLRAWGVLLTAAMAFAAATAVGTIYTYTAQVLTSFVASEHEAGLFAAAFRTFIVLGSVAGLLVTVAFPVLARAARDDDARLAYALQRVFETSAIIGIGAAVATVVGAPGVIRIMAGPDYADAVGSLRTVAVTLLASFVVSPMGFGLLSLHRHRGLLIANAAAFLTSLVAVGVLASAHGAEGAALGTVLAEATLAIGYVLALTHGRPDLRPEVGRPARALVAGGVALLMLLAPIPSIPAAVLALGVYVAALLVVRAVPDELLALVRRRAA
jgi:O-antigen/teichoic acid export membrane protein